MIQAAKYYTVGAAAVVIDVGLFQALVVARVPPTVAAGTSYALAAAMHFLVNRYWTFRATHRLITLQARTYLVIVGTAWVITVVTVGALTSIWHIAPFFAKLVSLAITLPLGFFGHKYLTYAGGIRAAFRVIAERRRQ